MYAPTVNSYKRYQPESWAPTALAWSVDNRTCGFRIVGHGSVVPHGVPHPGRRREPVPRVRGDDRGRARTASNAASTRPHASTATRTRRPTSTRVPASIVEAIEAFGQSKVAADAFGTDVHDHLLNTARQEWLAFGRAVTDWERRRNFDQW